MPYLQANQRPDLSSGGHGTGGAAPASQPGTLLDASSPGLPGCPSWLGRGRSVGYMILHASNSARPTRSYTDALRCSTVSRSPGASLQQGAGPRARPDAGPGVRPEAQRGRVETLRRVGVPARANTSKNRKARVLPIAGAVPGPAPEAQRDSNATLNPLGYCSSRT